MALKSTVFKAAIQLADMDRHVYEDLSLTIARHPSENDERMMVRILAFCINAEEGLQFTKGISTDNEPDLWTKSMSDEITLWIDLGHPDEKRVRKACNRSDEVIVYTYGDSASQIWWDSNKSKFARFDNLRVVDFARDSVEALTALAQRNMRLQCTIQDGEYWISDADNAVMIEPRQLSD